jgi:hypothetical protein
LSGAGKASRKGAKRKHAEAQHETEDDRVGGKGQVEEGKAANQQRNAHVAQQTKKKRRNQQKAQPVQEDEPKEQPQDGEAKGAAPADAALPVDTVPPAHPSTAPLAAADAVNRSSISEFTWQNARHSSMVLEALGLDGCVSAESEPLAPQALAAAPQGRQQQFKQLREVIKSACKEGTGRCGWRHAHQFKCTIHA